MHRFISDSFGKETCSPLQRYGPVKANHFLFHFVIDGKGEYWNLDTQKKYTIDKNKGFFMTPDTIGTYTADSEEPWSYLWIEFDGIKAAPFLKEAGINTKNPVFQLKNQLFLPNIVEPLETMIQYSHKHETFILAQLYLLMDHIISFSSSATSIRQSDVTYFYIREAIQLIQNHPQHNPTVEELANKHTGERPVVAFYTQFGLTGGKESTFDDMTKYLKVTNAAAQLGLGPFDNGTREDLIKANPDIIIIPSVSYTSDGTTPATAEQLYSDPALQGVKAIANRRVFLVDSLQVMSYSQFMTRAMVAMAQYIYGM